MIITLIKYFSEYILQILHGHIRLKCCYKGVGWVCGSHIEYYLLPVLSSPRMHEARVAGSTSKIVYLQIWRLEYTLQSADSQNLFSFVMNIIVQFFHWRENGGKWLIMVSVWDWPGIAVPVLQYRREQPSPLDSHIPSLSRVLGAVTKDHTENNVGVIWRENDRLCIAEIIEREIWVHGDNEAIVPSDQNIIVNNLGVRDVNWCWTGKVRILWCAPKIPIIPEFLHGCGPLLRRRMKFNHLHLY